MKCENKPDPGPDPESDPRNEPALKYQYLIYDAWHDDREVEESNDDLYGQTKDEE